MTLPPMLIEEPAMRHEKRRNRRQRPFHLYFKGKTRTFNSKADLMAYLVSMKGKK